MTRTTREMEAGGRRWRAVEAWRGPAGWSLVYFLPRGDGAEAGDGVVSDDGADRRAALGPGRTLSELDPDDLRELWEAGTGLTGTERRFRAPDGRWWLAQSVGPVWAEDGVAGGLTGVLFTRLEGPQRRVEGDGEHVGDAAAEELAGWWRAAVGESGAGDTGEGEA